MRFIYLFCFVLFICVQSVDVEGFKRFVWQYLSFWSDHGCDCESEHDCERNKEPHMIKEYFFFFSIVCLFFSVSEDRSSLLELKRICKRWSCVTIDDATINFINFALFHNVIITIQKMKWNLMILHSSNFLHKMIVLLVICLRLAIRIRKLKF